MRWINFKNGYYDPITGEMLEHNPDYLTINQIPFPYYPEDREQVMQGGENIKKYLASSLPNIEEQQTFWEYFGYCMTQDTQFQKFLTLKGNGGTGKSVAVSLIQHVVGINNMSSISLQDLNKTILCDWNVWKAVKCLCGYSLQSNGEHRCIKESSR